MTGLNGHRMNFSRPAHDTPIRRSNAENSPAMRALLATPPVAAISLVWPQRNRISTRPDGASTAVAQQKTVSNKGTAEVSSAVAATARTMRGVQPAQCPPEVRGEQADPAAHFGVSAHRYKEVAADDEVITESGHIGTWRGIPWAE
ncbi:hypothetical protein AB0B07_30485 [Streptomyces sioyaensis]|uniref:hypothetical protein n=1 Tax=Streptomyces sioyaensis TaxID=67364 RepID=UPI0033E5D5F0